MKKNILAIWGSSKSGKSETVRLIAHLLIKQYPKATIDKRIDKRVDIQYIITTKKHKIGIESQGDPNSRIFESIDELISEGCDLIICATRTRGKTVTELEEKAKNNRYNLYWATNYRNYSAEEKEKTKLNKYSAKEILSFINKYFL